MEERDLACGTASRREFVASLAAIGAASFVPGAIGKAHAAATKIRRVDMHHHFMPQHYMAEEHERSAATHNLPPSTMMQWTAQQALDVLDKADVQFAVASISTPGVWYGDVALGRRLAREWNEEAAKTVHDHPTRFGFFAPIPLPDTDGSLQEIDYALGALKADGINFLSNYDGKWLGDPAFAPVMDELNRRKAVVYVHPTFAPCCMNTVAALPPQTYEFPYDTARTIISVIVNGTTTRCPDIKWIFSHAGGALTGIVGRLSGLDNVKRLAGNYPAGFKTELRKLYYDTASAANSSTLVALMNLVPSSQIMFGSDYPFGQPAEGVEGIDKLKIHGKLRRAIDRDNALRLVPRIAQV